jgi:hypothetical protein
MLHVMSRDQLLWYLCRYYRLDFWSQPCTMCHCQMGL